MKYNGNLEITTVNQDKYKDITEVSGNLSVRSSATLASLTTVGGSLYVDGSATLDAPLLTTVGGSLYVDGSATLDAPLLTTVSGYLYVHSSATLDAPLLTTVGGDLDVHSSATLDAPLLTTVGGYLYVHSSATLKTHKNIKYNVASATSKCSKKLAVELKKKKLIQADGILSWLISSKKVGNVVAMKVRVVGKLEESFLIRKGEVFSHGKTVKEAKESLKYKIGNRDTSQFKKWTIKTSVTQAKMIEAYRMITGACEFGVRDFCQGKKLPTKLTVEECIKLTVGKFGNKQFKEFFSI